MNMTANMAGAIIKLLGKGNDVGDEVDYRVTGKISLSEGLLRSIRSRTAANSSCAEDLSAARRLRASEQLLVKLHIQRSLPLPGKILRHSIANHTSPMGRLGVTGRAQCSTPTRAPPNRSSRTRYQCPPR